MNDTSPLKANYIEFHYWFNDDSHSMDANIFNKCEYEALAIIKELSKTFKVDVQIDTEPIENGGLRSWLHLKANSKNITLKDLILVAVFANAISNIITAPVTSTITEITTQMIERLFQDKEIAELKKQKEIAQLEYDIAKLENETKELSKTINEDAIVKRRSNYYEALKQCDKVEKVTIAVEDKNKQIYFENKVERISFDAYIMTSNDLEPQINENAIIEIVSPVLKKGKYKWTGIYNGEVIQFSMQSTEFKTLIQTGQIAFKNGFSIDCELLIKRKIDNEGITKISGYEVLTVNRYFENDNPIETPEGKKNRQKKEADMRQLELF